MNSQENNKIILVSDDANDFREFVRKQNNKYDEIIHLEKDIEINQIHLISQQNNLLQSSQFFTVAQVDWFETIDAFNKINDALNQVLSTDISICVFINPSKLSRSKKVIDFIKNNFRLIEYESYNEKNAAIYVDTLLKNLNINWSSNLINDLILKTNYSATLLKNEINKLLLIDQNKFNETQIRSFISDYSNEQIFDLLKHLYSNNTGAFINLLNSLLDNNLNEVVIINMLITTMSSHYLIKKLYEIKQSYNEIAKIINKSDFVVKLNLKQTNQFSSSFLMKQIKILIEIDHLIKKGEMDKNHALFKWLLNFHKQQGV